MEDGDPPNQEQQKESYPTAGFTIDYRTLKRARFEPNPAVCFWKVLNDKQHKGKDRELQMIRLRTFHDAPHEGRVRMQRLEFVRHGARSRGGHGRDCLITLIDAISASQKLRLSPTSLELGARNGLIPHYLIGEQIRFDPKELDRWAREHRIDKGR
jgi:hypothetical protein